MWLIWFFQWIASWFKPKKQLLPKYEDSYPLGTRPTETQDNYKKEQVEEITPAGKVRMQYDDTDQCFLYWSDTTIPTRYLDTVARKYVIVFDKQEWYAPTQIEYTQRKQAELEGPFVKSKIERKFDIVKKMNHFKKKGGLQQVEIQKVDGKKISYLDYKHDNATVVLPVDEPVHDGPRTSWLGLDVFPGRVA